MATDLNLESISIKQKERLQHIDFNSLFFGSVGRKQLAERFGIAMAAATRDFKLYNELAPNNLIYSLSKRLYIKSEQFQPLFQYSEEKVVSVLSEGFGDHAPFSNGSEVTIKNLPDFKKNISLEILSEITRSIYSNKVLEIEYTSSASGKSERQICPHSIINNGNQFHIRAFDRKRKGFLNFLINRIQAAKILEEKEVFNYETKENDEEWNTIITCVIQPHPSAQHPETIAFDYGMKNNQLEIKTREALVGYVLRKLYVDCSTEGTLEGYPFELHLKNKKDFLEVNNMYLAPGFKL